MERMRRSRNLDHIKRKKFITHWNPIRTMVPGAIVYQTSAFISKRKTYFYPQHLRPLIEHKISSINSKIKACWSV